MPETDRVERVRSYFDLPKNYLDKRRFDIRVRAETVATFLEGRDYRNILDIGCGDGSISIPLLRRDRHLTLLDISENMLSLARSRVPAELAQNVEFRNADFLNGYFEKESFDVVVCMGVLAHVVSPADVVAKIAEVLKSGGTLLLECTDSFHPVGRIGVLRNQLAALVKTPIYRLNLLSGAAVLDIAERRGFTLRGVFRYSLPLFRPGWFSSHGGGYGLVRSVFGDALHNRNAWLGNQFIYCLDRPHWHATNEAELSNCLSRS